MLTNVNNEIWNILPLGYTMNYIKMSVIIC